jgi:hypothetical protein
MLSDAVPSHAVSRQVRVSIRRHTYCVLNQALQESEDVDVDGESEAAEDEEDELVEDDVEVRHMQPVPPARDL